MKFEDIKSLLDAGFTKDEIMKVCDDMVAPKAPEAPKAPKAPEAPEVFKAPETNDLDIANALASVTSQVTELSKTVKAMQDANAKSATGNAPTEKTVSDVVADFFGKP